MDKDTKKLLEAAKKQGFEVRTKRGAHTQVYLRGRRVATLSHTRSDARSYLNARAELKRAGFRP